MGRVLPVSGKWVKNLDGGDGLHFYGKEVVFEKDGLWNEEILAGFRKKVLESR
ncbi:MAG: hypothetical protein H6577_17235 [Lewinellaceae bacterium]|nr:hypothetical protein [Saprospiraceae bacterium]MCB9339872.1 hypothetical protein [Lewinellaceae bacterium]